MSKPRNLPVGELTRLAFVWAEQDRSSLAQCYPFGSEERAKHQFEFEQLQAYRKRRWGLIAGDRFSEPASGVSLEDLRKPNL